MAKTEVKWSVVAYAYATLVAKTSALADALDAFDALSDRDQESLEVAEAWDDVEKARQALADFLGA